MGSRSLSARPFVLLGLWFSQGVGHGTALSRNWQVLYSQTCETTGELEEGMSRADAPVDCLSWGNRRF